MVTLVGFLVYWPEDLPFFAPSNYTMVADGNFTVEAAVLGDPDYWLIIYAVSFAIICLMILSQVLLPAHYLQRISANPPPNYAKLCT